MSLSSAPRPNERRVAARKRVLFGAVVANQTDDRRFDCLVKNLSDLGARIEFFRPADVADELALTITHTGANYRARVVWRRDNALGLAFTSAPASTYIPQNALDTQIKDTKEAARLLKKVVDEALRES